MFELKFVKTGLTCRMRMNHVCLQLFINIIHPTDSLSIARMSHFIASKENMKKSKVDTHIHYFSMGGAENIPIVVRPLSLCIRTTQLLHVLTGETCRCERTSAAVKLHSGQTHQLNIPVIDFVPFSRSFVFASRIIRSRCSVFLFRQCVVDVFTNII